MFGPEGDFPSLMGRKHAAKTRFDTNIKIKVKSLYKYILFDTTLRRALNAGEGWVRVNWTFFISSEKSHKFSKEKFVNEIQKHHLIRLYVTSSLQISNFSNCISRKSEKKFLKI